MQEAEQRQPQSLERAWLVSALVGVALYAVWVFGLLQAGDVRNFGWSLYDEAFLAMLEGRLDLPARVLRYEGHFTPEGVGYLYHGFAPLLTRVLAYPFVDPATTPLGFFSIWFWGTLGTLAYHRAFFLAVAPMFAASGRGAAVWIALLAAAVWIGGAGLVVVSNISLYHEPIAVAYACAGGVILLWVLAVTGRMTFRTALIWMAVLAALAVHARPNIAVGLYLVVCIGLFRLADKGRLATWVRAGLVLAILGAGGLSYLGANAYRAGAAGSAHGTFAEGPLQYGTTYWGYEDPQSPRAAAFVEHGRFNLQRVLPNAAFYVFEPPAVLAPHASQAARNLHGSVTGDSLGFVRIEGPGGGIAALWLVWFLAAAASPGAGRRAWSMMTVPIIGFGASAILTTAYGTITLRYHIDLWPLLAVLSIIWLLGRSQRFASDVAKTKSQVRIIAIVIMLGGVLNLGTANGYRLYFMERAGAVTEIWPFAFCSEQAARKGFSGDDLLRVCQDPRAAYATQRQQAERS